MPYLVQKVAVGTPVGSWDLHECPLRFGRGEAVDVQIDDPEMSREHFVVECRDETYWVRDLESRNGLLVNGQRVTEQALKPNDKIRAGHSHFIFVAGLHTIVSNLEPGQLEQGS